MTGTIIYMTSNMEREAFEEKIIDDLLIKSRGLPIVSVSQKPLNLGTNICVGQVGASGYNFCRQVQIACENSNSDYVIHAEADCIYSPDYFKFVPKRLDIPYRNTNIYVQKYGQDFVCKKEMSTFSQVVGREFYLKRLKDLFKFLPIWNTKYKNFPKEIGRKLFDDFAFFETKYPCVSFKTGKGMRQHSPTSEIPVYELPYWGSIKDLRRKYENR